VIPRPVKGFLSLATGHMRARSRSSSCANISPNVISPPSVSSAIVNHVEKFEGLSDSSAALGAAPSPPTTPNPLISSISSWFSRRKSLSSDGPSKSNGLPPQSGPSAQEEGLDSSSHSTAPESQSTEASPTLSTSAITTGATREGSEVGVASCPVSRKGERKSADLGGPRRVLSPPPVGGSEVVLFYCSGLLGSRPAVMYVTANYVCFSSKLGFPLAGLVELAGGRTKEVYALSDLRQVELLQNSVSIPPVIPSSASPQHSARIITQSLQSLQEQFLNRNLQLKFFADRYEEESGDIISRNVQFYPVGMEDTKVKAVLLEAIDFSKSRVAAAGCYQRL